MEDRRGEGPCGLRGRRCHRDRECARRGDEFVDFDEAPSQRLERIRYSEVRQSSIRRQVEQEVAECGGGVTPSTTRSAAVWVRQPREVVEAVADPRRRAVSRWSTSPVAGSTTTP